MSIHALQTLCNCVTRCLLRFNDRLLADASDGVGVDGRRRLHEEIQRILADDAKSETLVQSPCGISDGDVQCDGRFQLGCIVEYLPDKPASNAFPTYFGYQGDVQYTHVLARVVHVETPNGPAVDHNDQKRPVSVVPAIMRALQVKLHAQEGIGLRRAPSDARELVATRAGVQRAKERLVFVPFVTEDEAVDDGPLL